MGDAGANNAGVTDDDDPSYEPGAQGGDGGSSAQGGASGSLVPNSNDMNTAAKGGSDQQTANAGASTGADSGVPVPVAPPAGTVPMFVAAGHGGRTITSCDDGKTWIANHNYENGNADHSAYTHKGLSYGNGMFMAILAWGADVSLKMSTDGVTWSRKTFGSGFYGGIAFGGDRFAMLRQGVTQYSSDLGKTWTRAKTQPRNDYREGGGGHGLPGGKGVFGGGGGNVPSMSWDGGETFVTADGCPSIDFGGIGGEGGVAAGDGNLVFVSSRGDFCHVTDNGKAITKGNLGSQISGKVSFTGGKFWIASGNTLFTSDTGKTWTKTSASPSTVSLQSVTRGDSGTYVGVGRSGSDFYRSADGLTWQKVPGVSGNSLVRVVFGYGSASAMCPAS